MNIITRLRNWKSPIGAYPRHVNLPHVILWRAIWLFPYHTGRIVAWFSVLMAVGYFAAREFWSVTR